MSAFETTLNVVGTNLGVPSEEALASGEASPVIEIELIVGQVLPFAAGPGQPPLQVPLGSVRYALGKKPATEFFKSGLKAAEELPEERQSQLEIATSLDGLDEVNDRLRKLKGEG